MNLKTIAVTYSRKLNLGDYNSAHCEISLWADVEDGDNEDMATEALRTMARNQVMTELARLDQRIAAKMENIFAGLPVHVRKITLPDEAGDYDFAAADDDHVYRYS